MASLTYGEFQALLRRTLLQDDEVSDEDGEYTYDEKEVRDYVHMALIQFADHTCQASSVSYTGTLGTEYALPDNFFTGERLDMSGRVATIGSSGTPTYLDPIYYTDGLSPLKGDKGFWTWPETTLHLSEAPSSTVTEVRVDYYAYYDLPMTDSDLITVPMWAWTPLLYLASAHALAGYSMKSAAIRQWLRKPEAGQPEHNPLRKQQEWFLEMYERELARFPRQDRINHFRVTDI